MIALKKYKHIIGQNMNNIVLIGLMGAGKSTIGKALSKDLNYNFIDIDEEIVKSEKMSINDIFKLKSETYFRELETKTIEKFSKSDNAVISLGGGAFENEKNRTILLNSSKVFYLKASIDTLFERIKTDNSRPLLKCDNPKEKLKELLKKREVNYEKAHYTINAENSLEEIIQKIKENL